MIPLCIPIQAKSNEEALKKMKEASKKGDMMEIWLDRIQNSDLRVILHERKKPVIVVNKGLREKGHFRGTEEKRIAILQKALDYGVEYIDIGIHSKETLIRDLIKKKGKTKIIISYHEFQAKKHTPVAQRLHFLEKISERGYELGADIIKIVTTAANTRDLAVLFELAHLLKQKKKKFIILSMGKLGIITRIAAPMLGSEWIYAPISEKEKTAEGQLPLQEMKSILKTLWHSK